MKIKLSKSQWEDMGKKAGWMKLAQDFNQQSSYPEVPSYDKSIHPKPYKPKPPKVTKQDIINNRLKGLKYWDEACKKTPRNEIIKRAIEMARDPRYEGTWGKSNSWMQFDWALGNSFRNVLALQKDIFASFNIDEALTPEEMAFIAKELGITEAYVPSHRRA